MHYARHIMQKQNILNQKKKTKTKTKYESKEKSNLNETKQLKNTQKQIIINNICFENSFNEYSLQYQKLTQIKQNLKFNQYSKINESNIINQKNKKIKIK